MCLQERRPCEEADGVPLRHPAAAQAARRLHSTGCARCRLHEQHAGDHQEISDEAPQTFHQRHGFVAARRFCNFLRKIIANQLRVSFLLLLLLLKKQNKNRPDLRGGPGRHCSADGLLSATTPPFLRDDGQPEHVSHCEQRLQQQVGPQHMANSIFIHKDAGQHSIFFNFYFEQRIPIFFYPILILQVS